VQALWGKGAPRIEELPRVRKADAAQPEETGVPPSAQRLIGQLFATEIESLKDKLIEARAFTKEDERIVEARLRSWGDID
jgi:hypothetical protein